MRSLFNKVSAVVKDVALLPYNTVYTMTNMSGYSDATSGAIGGAMQMLPFAVALGAGAFWPITIAYWPTALLFAGLASLDEVARQGAFPNTAKAFSKQAVTPALKA